MATRSESGIEFRDGRSSRSHNSTRGSYIKQQIIEIIQKASVVVCLIGNGTAWLTGWSGS